MMRPAATLAIVRPAIITFLVAVASALGGCGASAAEMREANTSGYAADFAIVYSEALAVVTEKYPRLLDSARRGVIQTSWHPLNIRQSSNNLGNRPTGQGQPGAQANPFGLVRGGAQTFFFIRFRVTVVGGNPWRIRIKGEASKWEQGATPVPLRGADTPPWLPARVDSLRLKIHRRLKKYAVRVEAEVDETTAKPAVKKLPKAGKELSALPKDAAAAVVAVREAAKSRQYADLRGHLADDLQWSEGAPPSADQAMAMWQADPSFLAKLVAALEAGCSLDGKLVVCPPDREPRAVFEQVGGTWKLRRFVAVD